MKIVVRGTNWIGDAVMSVPALRALRAIFANDEIVLLSPNGTADVFIDADFIDRVISFDANTSFMTGSFRDSRLLRPESFDLGLLFTNSLGTAFTLATAGVPKRIGYANDGRSPLLTLSVTKPDWKADRHEVYYYLNLVNEMARAEGFSIDESTEPEPIRLSVSDERIDAARSMLASIGIDPKRPTVALGVGSTNSRAKRWPSESFGALADTLRSTLDANILLVGSAGDTDVAKDVANASSSALIDLCGKTTVAEAAAILCKCDLMVSNDMGLAHLSPAVGTPTTVIFGPTNDVATRPFSEKVEILNKRVDCAPCMLRDCPIDHRCMTRISIDDVMESVIRQLGDNRN